MSGPKKVRLFHPIIDPNYPTIFRPSTTKILVSNKREIKYPTREKNRGRCRVSRDNFAVKSGSRPRKPRFVCRGRFICIAGK